MLLNPQMERLGSFKFGSAAASSGAIAIPARDMLLVVVRVVGTNVADLPALRFNADATAANYTSSFVNVTSAPAIARVNNAGTLAHIPIVSTSSTVGRVINVLISNFATTRKVCKILPSDEQTTTAAGTIDLTGYGEWLNTTAQITSIDMRTSGGTNTLSVGSGFTVFGWNH